MAPVVYVLCALASALCALLLGRAYAATRTPLLLWSTGCFVLLTVNNLLLVADRVIWTGTDLALARGIAGIAALGVLVGGLIWTSR